MKLREIDHADAPLSVPIHHVDDGKHRHPQAELPGIGEKRNGDW